MSSNGGRGSGIGDRDDRLDLAIDRAVREMLDVEPPAGLRSRVLDRIDALSTNPVASAFRRNIWWLAGPVAAAAVVVLAVLAPWRSARETEWPVSKSGADTRLVAESAPHPSIRTPETTAPAQLAVVRPAMPRRGLVEAATADTDANFTSVEKLVPPAPLAVAQLAGPPPPTVHTVSIASIEIRALEINPITETPRERREE